MTLGFYKILTDKKLIGSTTSSGFIIGKNSATCFQDAPLPSVCQNTWFEKKLRDKDKDLKVRYYPCGFMFDKSYAYCKGARPVIYDKTSEAKKYIDKDNWWRIVNFDLSNHEKIIDWTHEREWRVKGDFKFEISKVTLLFASSKSYKEFIELCDATGNDVYKKVAGIVNMQTLIF